MKFQVKVFISLKEGVSDSEGHAATEAVWKLGYSTVEKIRYGKMLQIKLEAANREEALKLAQEMCQKILVSPAIEDFELQCSEV